MKKSIFLLSILGALLISMMNTSCTTEGICRNGNGMVETDTLSLSAFTAVKLATAATVRVVQGTTQEVVITADQNVLEALDTRVEGDDLIIDVEGCFFSYDMEVFITVPASQPIRNFTVSGSGEIFVEDSLVLASDFKAVVSGSGELELRAANVISTVDLTISGSGKMDVEYTSTSTESIISGSGKLNLFGSTQSHKSRISGSGDLFSYDLSSIDTEITVSGSGDAEITVDGGRLDAVISGSGNVSYKGSPASINSSISGSGSLIDAN